MPVRDFACLLAAAAWLLAGSCQAAAAEPSDGIARLNAQRAANGIPAGITENPTWSEGCRLHLRYRARNGVGSNPHDEQPGLPGYTQLGDAAANNAILGTSEPWPADGRAPWEDAPLHLAQMLAPALMVSGYVPGCLWTWPGYIRRPAEPVVYSYPGDGTSIYPSQRAREWPFTPGDLVGLPQGTVTGPHLFVLGHGTGRTRLTAAAVTGPSGPIEIRTVDNDTRGPLGDAGRLLPPGAAIIIPTAPLDENARYRVTGTMTTDSGRALTTSFAFVTTAEHRYEPQAPRWPLPVAVAVAVSAGLHFARRRPRRR